MILSERAQRFASMADYTATVEDANLEGVAGVPGDGPYVVLRARVQDGRVEAVSYESHGCPSVRAAASCACWIASGKDLRTLEPVEAGDILVLLGGLPEGKESSADLAAQALGCLKNNTDA